MKIVKAVVKYPFGLCKYIADPSRDEVKYELIIPFVIIAALVGTLGPFLYAFG